MSKMDFERFGISKKTGFLSEKVSRKLLHICFEKWELAAQNLPNLIARKCVKKAIDELPHVDYSAETLSSEEEWKRGYVIVSFLSQAYVSEVKTESDSAAVILPSKLAIPWYRTSKHIGVPPVITYAAAVLYNYDLNDPSKPIEADNLRAALTFTGYTDESWFFVIHMLEEVAAVPGLEAIISLFNAVSSGDNVTAAESLKVIAATLEHMKAILKRMYDHCSPDFFYNKLRPYLAFPECGIIYSGVTSDVMKYRSGSGAQDTAIPAFSIVLGIQHEREEQETLDDFAFYMPTQHREYLEMLHVQPSVKAYVMESGDDILLKTFDEAVHALEAFRSQHISLVTSYIINVKQHQGENVRDKDRGTGGTAFVKFLKQLRDDTMSTSLQIN